jgi:hypothetical protein
MKPERIEELLKNTEYAAAFDTSRPRRTPEYDDIVEARSKLSKDAELNAARVQLLAKALQDAQEHLLQFIGCRCDSEDVGPGGCSACRHMGEIEAIQDALTEAGLNEQKEG